MQAKNTKTQFDKATALALGFGLHCAWVCTSMYSTNTVLGTSFNLPGIRGGSLTFLYLFSIVAFAATMFVNAVFDQRASAHSRSRTAMLIAALTTCVGTLLALIPLPASTGMFIIECASGITTGIGSAILMLYWAVAFARERSATILLSGAIATALGFSLNALVIQPIPYPFGGIVAGCLPLAEYAILRAITPPNMDDFTSPFNSMPSSKPRLGLSLVGAALFIGIALGFLKQASVQTTFVGQLSPATLILLFLGASLSIALFAFYTLLQKAPAWDTFLRVIVPVLACASIAISLAVSDSIPLSDLFLLLAYLLIETIAWVHFCFLAHRFQLSPLFLVGLSRGMLCIAMFASAVVVAYVQPFLDSIPFGNHAFIFLALVSCALGYALLPREADLMKQVVQCPAVRLVSIELDEGIELMRPAAVVASEDANAGSVAAEAQDNTGSAPAPAMIDENTPGQDESEARTAQRGNLNPSEPNSDPRAPREGSAPVGKFSRKVRRVAQTFLLTARETDILFELAKGNSPAYIQEKYYLSVGTVKTHIRNIYRKCNVHKRDDLLRLIEEIEDYD